MERAFTLDRSKIIEITQTLFLSCKNLIGAAAGYVAAAGNNGWHIDVLFMDPGGVAGSAASCPSMPVGGLHGEVLRSGRPMFLNDLSEGDRMELNPPGHYSWGNVLFAPLPAKGRIVGLFSYSNKPGGFREDDVRIATAFSEIAAVALSNAHIGEGCLATLQPMDQPAQAPSAGTVAHKSHPIPEDRQCTPLERILRQERRKLKTILDSLPDGVYIVDLNHDIQYANPAVTAQFGMVRGRKCYQYFHDLEAPCAWCQNDLIYNQECAHWEYRSTKTNKTYEVFSTPFLNENGTISKLDVMRDITSSREADKALAESELKYRTLVETMNEGLFMVNDQDRCTYVNAKACDMLGYSFDEIVGHSPMQFVESGHRKLLSEQMAKRRTGAADPYELTLVHRDGSLVHTLVSPRALFDAAGRYTGSFAVFVDISRRKRAEASLQDALSHIKRLTERLQAENVYFQEELNLNQKCTSIIGQSNPLKYVLYRAEQVAPTDATVLITGETGTGKGLLAAAIHQMSRRKGRPMVTVNCAALPLNLIESELFGRERGAFTGSDARQIGRFELAEGSTLCLDEISELPLDVQAKLLRAIQDHEFERLGSSRTLRVNTRIVATTNRNLEQEVREGRFRSDLFYRLNVFPLTVPPLRKRKDDIPLLVQNLAVRFGRTMGKQFQSVSRETMEELQAYDWPGNIRELENIIERAAILCPGPVLRLTERFERAPAPSTFVLKTMEEAEREHILKTLCETGWQINGPNGAASILDLPPSTLRSRMHKLGIHRPEMRSAGPRNIDTVATSRYRMTA